MTEGDRAPVDVDLRHVGVVLLLPRQHDRRERLVDLDEVDLVDRHLRPLEHLGRGRDRAGEHHHRVDAGERERVEARPRLEAELVRLLLAHDQHGRRAVGDLRRVRRRDHAVCLERRLQRRELLDRRVGADALVAA